MIGGEGARTTHATTQVRYAHTFWARGLGRGMTQVCVTRTAPRTPIHTRARPNGLEEARERAGRKDKHYTHEEDWRMEDETAPRKGMF